MLLIIASVISATNQPSDFSATVRLVRVFLMCFIYGLHCCGMINLFNPLKKKAKNIKYHTHLIKKSTSAYCPSFLSIFLCPLPPLPSFCLVFVQQIVIYKVCSVYIRVLAVRLLQWLVWACSSEKWIVYKLLWSKVVSLLTVLIKLKQVSPYSKQSVYKSAFTRIEGE